MDFDHFWVPLSETHLYDPLQHLDGGGVIATVMSLMCLLLKLLQLLDYAELTMGLLHVWRALQLEKERKVKCLEAYNIHKDATLTACTHNAWSAIVWYAQGPT